MFKLPPVIAFFVLVLAPGVVGQQDAIVSWGDNSHGEVSNTPSGLDFLEIAGADRSSLALRTDGSLILNGD